MPSHSSPNCMTVFNPAAGHYWPRAWRARRVSMRAKNRTSCPQTKGTREGKWRGAPFPADLTDRRVEITGPVERKMIINALNSGARVFMADFEDSNSPTWENNIQGHLNLRDA